MPVDVTALIFKVHRNASGLEPLTMSGEVAFQFTAARAVWSLEIGITNALHAWVFFHDHDLAFNERLAVVFASDTLWFSSSHAFE